MPYTGPSISDYLKSIAQPYDYASRATLAASKGIQGYIGSAEQNTQLLNILRGGGASTTPTAPSGQPSPQPQQTQTQTATPQTQGGNAGFGDWLRSHGYNDENVINNAIANPSTAGSAYQNYLNETGAGTSGVSGFLNQPTINLPELYEGLYASSGITGIQDELSGKTKAYNEAVAKIKDNPYLSEATMTGRLSKLSDKFNADTQAIRSDIAMKKADIETKLNLQTQQFNINSQQATQALNQFNSLLASGALDNASGEDIANITRATGISSSMIQSAIKARQKTEVDSQLITSTADSGEVTATLINKQTGEIINQTSLGNVGNQQGGTSVSEKKDADKQETQNNAIADIQAGSTLRDIINHYAVAGGLTVEELYRLYNSNSPYGKAGESLEEAKEGKFKA